MLRRYSVPIARWPSPDLPRTRVTEKSITEMPGSVSGQMMLSELRAEAVRVKLIAGGVRSERISVKGQISCGPICYRAPSHSASTARITSRSGCPRLPWADLDHGRHASSDQRRPSPA